MTKTEYAEGIAEKVDIVQGIENAGKILTVGDDGNITVGRSTSLSFEDTLFTLTTLTSTNSSSGAVYSTMFRTLPLISGVDNSICKPIHLIPGVTSIGGSIATVSYYNTSVVTATDIEPVIVEMVSRLTLPDGTYRVLFASALPSSGVFCIGQLPVSTAYFSFNVVNSSPSDIMPGPATIYASSRISGEHPILVLYSLLKTA